MASTTAAIRDRVRALIEALAPAALASDKFRSSRAEAGADFIDWAEKNSPAALRRFQVRDDGNEDPPEVSDTLTDMRHVTLVIEIAYPHTSRYGADQAFDRDDVIDLDWGRINGKIGIYGRANFSGAYDCTPLGAERSVIRGAKVDVLEVRMRLSYYRKVQNIAPTAAFTSSVDLLVATFTDTSVDQDGTVVSYAWDFGDGATSTAQNPGHTYASSGTYAVTLTVTDDDGDTGTITSNVAINPVSTGQLVLVAGQSNAVGRGIAERLDPALGLASSFASVQMSAKIGSAGIPPTWNFELTARDLQPYTTGATQSMGVELSLGRMLYDFGRTNTFMGKFAMNSASLAGHYADAGILAELDDYIDQAVLDSGEDLGVLVWIQGEADAGTEAHALAYQANLTAFISALRSSYGNFRLVLVKLNDECGETYTSTVRAAQVAYAASDDNCLLIAADDLPLNGDALHYDEEEIAVLGMRIGRAILDDLGIADTAAVTFPAWVRSGPAAYGSGVLYPVAPPHKSGDILYLQVATGMASSVPSLSTANGYTLVPSSTANSNVDLGGGPLHSHQLIYELRADQTTMDANGGQMPLPVVADNNNVNAAKIHVFRPPSSGTLTGTAVSGTPSVGGNNNYTAEIVAPLSAGGTGAANCLVALFVASQTGGNNTMGALTNASLANITERQDGYLAVGGDRLVLGMATGEKAAAGAYNATTGNMSNSGINASTSFGIKP